MRLLLERLRERRRAREDDAWSDGYNLGEEEFEEMIADKDAFIAEQSLIIQSLIEVINCEHPSLYLTMPSDLYERLMDYV